MRDNDPIMVQRLLERTRQPHISIITSIELAGGANGPGADPVRRALLGLFLQTVTVLDLGHHEASIYTAIVEAAGFSRRKILDRLIAASALSHSLPLATLNTADFADVPGLNVVDWR